MAKIYTKVGDKGQTSLVGGQKVAKNDLRLDAYGTIDELNSVIGVARVAVDRAARSVTVPDSLFKLSGDLEKIQHWLFNLGSLLATEAADRAKMQLPSVGVDEIKWLEGEIDGATAYLKPLRTFILPGGSEAAAYLHVARTVARRAERFIVAMGEETPENSIPFINRLSDYLFVVARLANHCCETADVTWEKT